MGVLFSVNVGLPRDVEWRGRTVHTAVWKQPVQGRVRARRLNLDGDAQGDLAAHGGEHRAVLVYQRDSYRHWASYLARSDLVAGSFGENLTVDGDGLSDAEVCIGDRFRIGTALFEVTQPRVTCYRVGLRLGRPDMAALLVAHRRPGFYLRVIEEGEVGAGDAVTKVAEGPEQMSVAEIDALLYMSDHPVDALERALRIPALSLGWQDSMKALRDAAAHGQRSGNAGLSAPVTPLAWRGFRPLTVVAARMESDDVRSFEMAAPDGSALPRALPGQNIVVRIHPGPGLPAVLRNYSLCGPPDAATYQIAVKNENGAMSAFLHTQLRVGDTLEVSAPRGSFTLASGDTPVVLLSAGIGLTPLLGMLRAAAAAGAAPRDIWWIHSARDGAHHSFAATARALVAGLARGHRYIVYSRPGSRDRQGSDYDILGRLSIADLQRLGVPRGADFYLCGPAPYMDDLERNLAAWGVAAANIHREIFGSAPPLNPGIAAAGAQAPHRPAGPQGSGPLVTFARSGLAVHWDTRFNSLLELAEACAVPVRWSCRTGVCHNCESGLIDGALRYSPEPLDPPAEGNVLICCAAPASNVELDL